MFRFNTHRMHIFYRIQLSLVFFLLFFILSLKTATAAPLVLYVTPPGNGDCSSWATACGLQTALNTAQPGSEIWVAGGTYNPSQTNDRNASFTLKSGVAVYGGFVGSETSLDQRNWKANITILSGDLLKNDRLHADNLVENSLHVVTASNVDDKAILDGFKIIGGNANSAFGGGVLLVNSSPTLMNIVFVNNVGSEGGALSARNGSNPYLINTVFSNNRSYRGGAINADTGTLTIINSVFTGNLASDRGGAIYNYENSITLINTTISNNVSMSGGAIYNTHNSLLIIKNSILWINQGTLIDEIDNNGGSTVSYFDSIVTGVTNDPVNGVYGDRNPIFLNPGAGNYRPEKSSPTVDAGKTTHLPVDARDLDGDGDITEPVPFDADGESRTVGSSADLGAYEYQSEESQRTPGIIYVDHRATTGSNDGSSWSNAFADLQLALTIAVPGDQIWVAGGVYLPSPEGERMKSFSLKSGVALYGGFAGDETQLSQHNWRAYPTILTGDLLQNDSGDIGFGTRPDNSFRVVTGANLSSDTRLDGFTITAGHINITYGDCTGSGISLINSNPKLSNLFVHANFAGSAIRISSGSVSLNNILVEKNQGGGLGAYDSNVLVVNSVFVNNTNGAINSSGTITLINDTVYSNSNGYGGGLAFSGSALIHNSIFWNNRAYYGSPEISTSGTLTITHSLVRGISNNPSQGVYGNRVPLFVNAGILKFQPAPGSPAIDAGDTSKLPADAFDLDGDGDVTERIPLDMDAGPRVHGNTVDLGAFEQQPYPRQSKTLYVDDSATGTNDGSSWENAYVNLTDAIAAAIPQDQIWVAAGTYQPTSSALYQDFFSLGSHIAMYGGFNGTESALEQRDWKKNVSKLTCSNTGTLIFYGITLTNTTILDGFTIQKTRTGTQDCGGMVLWSGSPTLTNLVFDNTDGGVHSYYGSNPTFDHVTFQNGKSTSAIYTDETSTLRITNSAFTGNSTDTSSGCGGAIWSFQNTPYIDNVTFTNNKAYAGGAICIGSGGLRIKNSTFANNSAPDGGGAIYYGEYTGSTGIFITNTTFLENNGGEGGAIWGNKAILSVTNSVFFKNKAGIGGAVYLVGSNSATFTNTTFFRNSASDGGAALYNQGSNPKIRNSILWDISGTTSVQEIYNLYSSVPDISYSFVKGMANDPSKGIYGDRDPQFNNVFGGYLGLNDNSPAINAGSSQILPADDLDVDGDGNRTELLPLDIEGKPRLVGDAVDLGAFEQQLVPPREPTILYVNDDANGKSDGTSWANAYTSLQSAFSSAIAGDQIWVAAGTYKPTPYGLRDFSFTLRNGVAIYGGFAGNETNLNQRDWRKNVSHLSGDLQDNDIENSNANFIENSYHVLVANNVDKTAILDGFTISGGYPEDAELNYAGGGIHLENSSPILANLIFTKNWSVSRGGALYNKNSYPYIVNTVFLKNVVSNVISGTRAGGAIYNENSSPIIVNSVFWSNSASTYGGAIYNLNSNTTLINVTFSGNRAQSRGGAIYNEGSSNVTLFDSILWGDTANNSPEIYYQSPPTVSCSIVQGISIPTQVTLYGGSEYNPLFTDTVTGNLQVANFSPVINKGCGTLPADEADLDYDSDTSEPLPVDLNGLPRITDGKLDMGAYEHPTPNHAPVLDVLTFEMPDVIEDTLSTEGITVRELLADGVHDIDGDPIGIAVTSVSGSAWKYRPVGSSDIKPLNEYPFPPAILLEPDDRIYYIPAQNWYGTTTGVTFVAWDGHGAKGGGKVDTYPTLRGEARPYSFNTGKIKVTVIPVNDPPVNVTSPWIIGLPYPGETLTASVGQWNDSIDTYQPTLSFGYQWQRATSKDGPWQNIAESTRSTYITTEGELGLYLRVLVTATDNGVGEPPSLSAQAVSGPIKLVIKQALISEGDAVTVAMDEDSSPTPFRLTVHTNRGTAPIWSIAVPPDNGAASINTEGVVSYTPSTNRHGQTSFVVLAAWEDAADSIIVQVTINPRNDPPYLVKAPTLPHIIRYGLQVQVDPGTWSDFFEQTPGTIRLSYQWQRYNGGWENIPEETMDTYTPVAADAEKHLRVVVTAVDDGEGLPVSQSTSAVTNAVLVANTAPVITEGTNIVITSNSLTLHATDAENNPLSWLIYAPPVRGTAQVDEQGQVTYQPNPGCNGLDQFVVAVFDGNKMDTIQVDHQQDGDCRFYVNAAAAPGNNGLSWETAFSDLQSALTKSRAGDEVWVATGTYKPAANGTSASFIIKNGVAVYGGFVGTENSLSERNWRKNRTVLSGDLRGDDSQPYKNYTDNSIHVVTIEQLSNSMTILDGFTIQDGYANSSSPNNVGGGLYNMNGSPTLSNLSFVANYAINSGGAIYSGGKPFLVNVSFINNYAVNSGGAIYQQDELTLVNGLFINNTTGTSGSGGAIYHKGTTLQVINATIYGNRANYGGAIHNNGLNLSLHNSILWANQSASTKTQIGSTGSPTISIRNSLIQDITNDPINSVYGDPAHDPQFVNIGVMDLHIMPVSWAANSGSSEKLPADLHDLDGDGDITEPVPFDLEGNARISGSSVDLGAYELADVPQHPATVLYVDQSATGNGDGSSWANAYVDLQQAISAALTGDQIWVANGRYLPGSQGMQEFSFALKKGVAIYGGFAGTEASLAERDWQANPAILSGDLLLNDDATSNSRNDNFYRVVTAENVDLSAVLDGFTISGGYASGIAPFNNGGGMYMMNSSPTLSRLLFSGNAVYTGNGGGLYMNNSAPVMTSITFAGNTSFYGYGGAIYSTKSITTLDGFDFSSNTARGGGAISKESGHLTIANSTFINNTSTVSGGAIGNANDEMTITNSTFTQNTANESGSAIMHSGTGSLNVTGSTFTGNWATKSVTYNTCGGTVCGYGGSVNLINDRFIDNISETNGGATGFIGMTNVKIVNSIFLNNTAKKGNGGAIYSTISWVDDDLNIINTSFYGNKDNAAGAIYATSDLTVQNSIFWGNEGTTQVPEIYTYSSSKVVFKNSLIEGWTNDSLNAVFGDRNPLFSDPGNGDLHLKAESPAINAGSNAWLLADLNDLDGDGDTSEQIPFDLDGKSRVVGSSVDLGAYENDFIPVITTIAITEHSPSPSIQGDSVLVKVQVTALSPVTETPVGRVVVSADTGETCYTTLSSGSGACSLPLNTPGTRTITVEYSGKDAFTQSATSIQHVVYDRVVRVDSSGLCGGKDNCFRDLQTALNAAPQGGQVMIFKGTYTGDIVLSKELSVSAYDTLILDGSLSIQFGTFTVLAGDLLVLGDFKHTGGIFQLNEGILVLTGSKGQHLSTINPIRKLQLNGPITLDAPLMVENLLTLDAAGLLKLGSYDMTLGPTASIKGSFSANSMIVADGLGKLVKQFDGPGSFTFPVGDQTGTSEYSPAMIRCLGGNFGPGGAIAVNLVDDKHPEITMFDSYLTRYWTVGAREMSDFQCDFQFQYTDTDIIGNEQKLYGMRYHNGQWTTLQAVASGENTFSGQTTSFSDFFAASLVPTESRLTNLQVQNRSGMVHIEWETELESNLLGFHIYRSEILEGERLLLTLEPIAAYYAGRPEGASYEWVDETATPGVTYYYWIELIFNDQRTLLLDPVTGKAGYSLMLPLLMK